MIIPILILAQIMGQTIPAQPQPQLHCGKYEHVAKGHPGYSGGACDGSIGPNTNCIAIAVWHEAVPDVCVDDMHEITERDWQALMDRITKLESKK